MQPVMTASICRNSVAFLCDLPRQRLVQPGKFRTRVNHVANGGRKPLSFQLGYGLDIPNIE
jgi:hypothetical protein